MSLGDEHITRAAREVRDGVNLVLHHLWSVEPCESACTHIVSGEWTALGIANVIARKDAAGAVGDEHITRAARVLLEELPPTDLTIETMGEAAAHEEWRKIAARVLEAAGAVGDVTGGIKSGETASRPSAGTEVMRPPGAVSPNVLEMLARLSHAAGRFIECDERPRPSELWKAMCDAQAAAATYLNTGEWVAR